jgi:hypothetical protein
MLDHLIAFLGLGLEQKLVDDSSVVSSFAQASGALLQGTSTLRFLTGGGVQRVGALRAIS